MNHTRHAATAIILASLAAPALAQPLTYTPAQFVLAQPVSQREQQAKATPSSRDLEIRLGAEGEAGLKSDLKSTTGDVQVSRLRASIGLGIPIADRSNLDITFDNEWSFYDFSEPSGFGAKQPWDDTWERGLRLVFSTQQTERLAWFIGGDINAASEYGADLSDSLTYGGLGGVRYKFADSFVAGLGIYARTRLESDAIFLPYIAFLWNIAPQWSLSSQNGRSVRFAYHASEALAIFLEGGYESREYRLDDEGPAPDGIGKDRKVPVALGAQWHITPKLTFTGKAGAYAWQRYRLDDKDGSKISEFEADAAPFFALELRLVF